MYSLPKESENSWMPWFSFLHCFLALQLLALVIFNIFISLLLWHLISVCPVQCLGQLFQQFPVSLFHRIQLLIWETGITSPFLNQYRRQVQEPEPKRWTQLFLLREVVFPVSSLWTSWTRYYHRYWKLWATEMLCCHLKKKNQTNYVKDVLGGLLLTLLFKKLLV